MGKITNVDQTCPGDSSGDSGNGTPQAGTGGFDDGTGRKKRSGETDKSNYNTNPTISRIATSDIQNISVNEYDIDEKLFNYDY